MKSRSVLLIFLSLSLFNTFGMQSSLELLQRGVDASRPQRKSELQIGTALAHPAMIAAYRNSSGVQRLSTIHGEQFSNDHLKREVLGFLVVGALYGIKLADERIQAINDEGLSTPLKMLKSTYPYTPYLFCLYDFWNKKSDFTPHKLALFKWWVNSHRNREAEKILKELEIEIDQFLGVANGGSKDSAASAIYRKTGSWIELSEEYDFDGQSLAYKQFVLAHEAAHIIEKHALYKRYFHLLLPLLTEFVVIPSVKVLSSSSDQFVRNWHPDSRSEWLASIAFICLIDTPLSLMNFYGDSFVGRYMIPQMLKGYFDQYCEMRADLFATKKTGSTKGQEEAFIYFKARDNSKKKSSSSSDEFKFTGSSGYLSEDTKEDDPSKSRISYLWQHLKSLRNMIDDSIAGIAFSQSHPPVWLRLRYCKLYNRYWLGNES